jgi:putative flippase GtrA
MNGPDLAGEGIAAPRPVGLPATTGSVGRPTRLLDRGVLGELARFAVIGVISTLAYLALYSLLRGGTGAQPANLVALLVTAVGNTAANRRMTFGVRGRQAMGRHQMQGLLVFGIGLALTSGSLALLQQFRPHPARIPELSVLVMANGAATLARFLLLRHWVFAARSR